MTVELTVALPNFGSYLRGVTWRQFFDLARMADDFGVDRIVIADHVVMGGNTDAYPWGEFVVPADAPYLEPMIMLAGMAAVTTRVRLSTGILIAPLRPAAVLAKMAATLDVLSDGRLDLGVGVGWQREEYEAVGLRFEERWQRLTDTMLACRSLWARGPATFSSKTVAFTGIYCEPKPVQEGGVPIWLGGGLTVPNVQRLASWADGWIPIPVNGEEPESIVTTVANGTPAIRAAWAQAGRDPAGLRVRPPLPLLRTATRGPHDLARSVAMVPALVTAGATDVSVPMHAFCRDLTCAESFFAELTTRFRDALEGGAGTWARSTV